ncbi:MAG: DUF2264 domain-containing protein [Eisenbergiella massiliensis]
MRADRRDYGKQYKKNMAGFHAAHRNSGAAGFGKRRTEKDHAAGFSWRKSALAPLEAFGRSMLSLAPWLEAEGLEGEEKELQETYRSLAVRCIDKATDPESADFMIFNEGGQPLVDTAFLCHALVRAPRQLAGSLPERVHRNLAAALRSSRQIVACNSNWIFFSAMVEAGLYVLGEKDYDKMRIAYALRVFDGWYKGDGVYGDGEMFHWDYYNSFVIQPMYLDLAEMFVNLGEEFRELEKRVAVRAARYASVLERMIAPDGSYPILGRSICYRFGAFQMLSQGRAGTSTGVAEACPGPLCIDRGYPQMYGKPGNGLIKMAGCSRSLRMPARTGGGDINVGSLYLCSAVFLPLGLPVSDPFWADEDADWTSRKVWSGGHVQIDHAID